MKHLPVHNEQFEAYYKDFAQHIKTKGYSRGNACYANQVREFLFFIESLGFSRVQDVKAIEIIAYHDYLKERPNQRKEGGLSDSMIKGHLFALRLFFDYLLDMEIVDASPARLPKFQLSKSKEREILEIEEIKILYNQCESKRDVAIISLAYGCGLRRSEIYKLNTTDVFLHKGIVVIRDSKFHKSRTIPLSDKVMKDLREYVIYERPKYFTNDKFDESHAFIINNIGTRMKADKINERVGELIRKSQNYEMIKKEITLHCLRHSIATHLIDNGAKIEFVQQFLGHSGMDTSHLYAKRRKRKTALLQTFG